MSTSRAEGMPIPQGRFGQAAPVSCDIFQLTWPLVMSNVLRQANGLVTVFFVSGFNDAYFLGSVGLGAMAQNVFGFSLGLGFNGALDTLVSQSHGAGRHELSGLFLWQAQVLTLWICIPAMVALSFARYFFQLVGIDHRTAYDAGEYVRGTLFTMPLFFLYDATRAFLRASQITRPDWYVTGVVALLHPVWCFLFLHVLDWGPFGAGFATTCSNAVSFVLLTAYVAACKPGPTRDAWRCFPWPCQVLRQAGARREVAQRAGGMRYYAVVALKTALLVWSEWWVYEVMSLLAGLCGTDALAAHTAACNLLLILFMIPVALSSAVSALVGNAMGESNPKRARSVICLSCTFVAWLFAILAALVLILRRSLARLFSREAAVVEIFERICLVMAPFIMGDAVQTVLEGALRGLGLQGRASQVKLVSMCVVRLVGAYLLALQAHWGVIGIWTAGLAGILLTLVLYLLIMCSTNFGVIAQEVQQRLRLQTCENGAEL